MSQDFIFIDPQKIPPRRVTRGNVKKRQRSNNSLEPVLSAEPAIDLAITEEFDLFSTLPDNHEAILTANPLAQETDIDPLTQEIFQGLSMESDYSIDDAIMVQPETVKPTLASREAILSELEKIENQDQKLSRKNIRFQPPYRRARTALTLKPNVDTINTLELAQDQLVDQIELTQVEASKLSSLALAQAQDDWYGIDLAGQPGRPLLNQKKQVVKKNSPAKFKIWLATLVLFLPLAFSLFFFNQPRLKSFFEQVNNKILTADSFTLINTSASKPFPYLISLKKYLSQSSDSAGTIALIDQFLESNSTFNWLNLFKKKEAQSAIFSQLELLDKLGSELKQGAPIIGAPNIVPQFSNYLAWLNFWQRLMLSPETVLVVVLDAENARPIGGKPMNYVLLKFDEGKINVLNSGKFSSLDAASNLKIIPPEPLQFITTSWRPSEAGWFLNFNDSAETLLDFFNKTAQTSAAGLITLNSDFLQEAGFKESILFDLNKSDWFDNLSNSLSRKSEDRWENLSEIFKDGLSQHKVQFYFRDPSLKNFIQNSNWAMRPQSGLKEDVFGLGLIAPQGGVDFELIEHKVNVFEDGSLSVRMNLTLRQNPVESLRSSTGQGQGHASKNYLKIYLPKDSQILKQEGFSMPEKKPIFDYASQGFSADARLNASDQTLSDGSQIKDLDIFKESGLLVAAGWFDLALTERKIISLEYLLPFRLDYKRGLTDYHFKIWQPHQKEKTAFRFQLLPQKAVEIISLEPNGFITQNLGEYQGNLSGDLTLLAKLRFFKEP